VTVLNPTSVAEAVAALRDNPKLVPVAGCTDLLVCSAEQRQQFDAVLDLTRIPEIRGITDYGEFLEIGATTTFSEISASQQVCQVFPALAQAARVVGGWQIQNRATLGGNIANASPAGDSLPVLLALDAVVVTIGPADQREIAYVDFHSGYRQTALHAGEIIARIRLPVPRAHAVQLFTKVGTRQAQAISKVVVAMACNTSEGRLSSVRFGAGSVAATPIRLRETEAVCEGQALNASLADRAGHAARGEVQPIDDVRSTAEYRREVLGRVVRTMVLKASKQLALRSPPFPQLPT